TSKRLDADNDFPNPQEMTAVKFAMVRGFVGYSIDSYNFFLESRLDKPQGQRRLSGLSESLFARANLWQCSSAERAELTRFRRPLNTIGRQGFL
ncbi:MAG TPA: hypothetical protein VK551_00450, partial [Thermodesulfobacteriota bacterium]|nr:hypothetical protein [Thermodesulfobacteriota bacterium]